MSENNDEYEDDDEYEDNGDDDEMDSPVFVVVKKKEESSSSAGSKSGSSSSSEAGAGVGGSVRGGGGGGGAGKPFSSSPDGYFDFYKDKQIQGLIDSLIQKEVELICKSPDEILILLIQLGWNTDKLESDLTGEKRAKVLKDNGLVPDSYKPPAIPPPAESADCNICCDGVKRKMLNLPCGHSYCNVCAKDYFNSQAKQRKILIECIFCKIFVYPSVVKSFLTPQNLGHYEKNLQGNYLGSKAKKMKNCPAPSCDFVVEKKNIFLDCKCVCGKEFCVGCGETRHSPATCVYYRNWKALTEKGDQQNEDWVNFNTMKCPKCQHAVFRISGCNYMACSCGKAFCYVCGDFWEPKHKDHFHCPQPPTVKTMEDRKTAESRFNYNKHYIDLWETQVAQVRRTEDHFQKKGDQQMREYMEISGFTIQDCQFIKTALTNLIECRKILASSFIYGHGMGVDPHKSFFEFIQEDLIRYADQLRFMLEAPVKEINRTEMVKLSNIVQSQSQRLNERLLIGFAI